MASAAAPTTVPPCTGECYALGAQPPVVAKILLELVACNHTHPHVAPVLEGLESALTIVMQIPTTLPLCQHQLAVPLRLSVAYEGLYNIITKKYNLSEPDITVLQETITKIGGLRKVSGLTLQW